MKRREFITKLIGGAVGAAAIVVLPRTALSYRPACRSRRQERLNWTKAQWMEAFKGIKSTMPAKFSKEIHQKHREIKSSLVSNIRVQKLLNQFQPGNHLRFVHQDLELWTDYRAFWGLDSAPGWPQRMHIRVQLKQDDVITNPRQLAIAKRKWEAK